MSLGRTADTTVNGGGLVKRRTGWRVEMVWGAFCKHVGERACKRECERERELHKTLSPQTFDDTVKTAEPPPDLDFDMTNPVYVARSMCLFDLVHDL